MIWRKRTKTRAQETEIIVTTTLHLYIITTIIHHTHNTHTLILMHSFYYCQAHYRLSDLHFHIIKEVHLHWIPEWCRAHAHKHFINCYVYVCARTPIIDAHTRSVSSYKNINTDWLLMTKGCNQHLEYSYLPWYSLKDVSLPFHIPSNL